MMLSGPKNRRRLKALALAAAVFACGVPAGYAQSLSRPAISLSQTRQISTVSEDNRNPAVAFSPDGRQLFVAWDGIIKGKRRIFLRERVAGQWLPLVIVDSNPAGNNSRPSIAVDRSGVPHLTWITTNGHGQRVPAYARRLAREQNSWYQQIVPFPPDAAASKNCNVVNLQLDGANQPWIAWQYGYGNIYNIAISRFSDSGNIISYDLTPGSTTHNLYPELFFTPEPVVYWYTWDTDQFYLIASRFNTTSNEWKLTPPENLELLPTSSLPDLFYADGGPLAAIWYDRHVASENGTESDRIFLGLQDPETKGRGEVIGPDNGSSNDSVFGASSDGLITASWISETYETGTEVLLGVGHSPADLETAVVSSGGEWHNSNPKVSLSMNEAAVVWEQQSGPEPDSAIILRSADLQ